MPLSRMMITEIFTNIKSRIFMVEAVLIRVSMGRKITAIIKMLVKIIEL